MKTAFTALAMIMMLSTMPAMAHDIDAKTDYYMKKIDTNGDGKISKDEHQAFGDKMFTEADTNGDGFISRDELKAAKQKEHDEMAAKMPMKKSSMMKK